MSELQTKLSKIYELLDRYQLDGLYLARISSFAWATCGAASYINTATTTGEAALFITRQARYLITNNIEAPHYEIEEQLKAQGWDFQIRHWYEPDETLAHLSKGLKVGTDICLPGLTDLSAEITTLRGNLLPEEQARYREVSRCCAQAMEAAIRLVRPGMSEYEIAGLLAREAYDRDMLPIVDLIATDERISGFRHPLPAHDKKLEKYAMLILCGRRYGLVTSVTRLVHFGPLPEVLKKKQAANLQVDARVISATRPGATVKDMFATIQQAYESAGYPGEWQRHHQGGPAGYEPRELLATPSANFRVQAGQAYAWNPTITGVKVEDTILITDSGFEIMTEMPGWPMTDIEVDGQTIRRPLILEI